MGYKSEKVKSIWLLSFGDLITLLVTFFILMIVLNKGEINRVQKWAEVELDKVYQVLSKELKESSVIQVSREIQGVQIEVKTDSAFIKGGFEPSDALLSDLKVLADKLKKLPLLASKNGGMPSRIEAEARKRNLILYREISVAGYTDNDVINPDSRLRNNWFLSSMRAQNVMLALYRFSGLPPDRFSQAGYGQYRPVASNATPEGKNKNRRIQLLIVAHFETSH